MRNSFLFLASIIAGTIIGAGIFSLPYVFSNIGFTTGVVYLFGFSLMYGVIYRMYAKLIYEQKERHGFLFLIRKYFYKNLVPVASFTTIGGLLFGLVAYLALIPSFGNFVFDIPGTLFVVVFWAFGSLFFFLKPKYLGFAELIGTASILSIIVLLIVFAFGFPETPLPEGEPLTLTLFLIPFGPLLFSFSGRAAVSEATAMYRKVKSPTFKISNVITVGTLIPAFVYLIFVIAVLRMVPEIAPDTLSSLSFLPMWLKASLAGLGFFALFTSFVMLGTNVRDILRLDLKLPWSVAALVPTIVPLGLFLVGLQDFFAVLSFAGGLFVSLESILIISMWRRHFKTHRFRNLATGFYIIFFAAIVYSFVELLIL